MTLTLKVKAMTESRQCPACSGVLIFSHEDDVYTKFFRCQQCGTVHSLRTTPEELAMYTRRFKELRHKAEDKPKGSKPKCGGCAAFHTPFCSFAYTDEPCLKLHASDHACTRFYSRLPESAQTTRRESFARRVENL